MGRKQLLQLGILVSRMWRADLFSGKVGGCRLIASKRPISCVFSPKLSASLRECARHLRDFIQRPAVGRNGRQILPFSPLETKYLHVVFREISIPFSKSASSCFFSPPLRSEAIRELEDEGCRNICWEIVHCFVTIGSWILGGMKMENNVFIWKIKEFV